MHRLTWREWHDSSWFSISNTQKSITIFKCGDTVWFFSVVKIPLKHSSWCNKILYFCVCNLRNLLTVVICWSSSHLRTNFCLTFPSKQHHSFFRIKLNLPYLEKALLVLQQSFHSLNTGIPGGSRWHCLCYVQRCNGFVQYQDHL